MYMPLPSRIICVAFSGCTIFRMTPIIFLLIKKKNCVYMCAWLEVFHTLLKMILTPMMDEPFSKVIAKNFVFDVNCMHDAVRYYAVLHSVLLLNLFLFSLGIQFLFGILMKLREN